MADLAAVHWSPEALDDLERLFLFLMDKSPDAARRALTTIQASVERIRLFPAAGRPVADMRPEYRELIVGFGTGGYVVYYFFDGRTINVLSVRHFRENPAQQP